MINRILENNIAHRLNKGKAIIVMGARQVGKTTLLNKLFESQQNNIFWLNGDNSDTLALFNNFNASRFKALIGNTKTLIIDEAQRISDIGIKLKQIIDQIPDLQVVV